MSPVLLAAEMLATLGGRPAATSTSASGPRGVAVEHRLPPARRSEGGRQRRSPIDGRGSPLALPEIRTVLGLALAGGGHVVAKEVEQGDDEAPLRSLLVSTTIFLPFLTHMTYCSSCSSTCPLD